MNRSVWVPKLLELLRSCRNGQYYVRRGMILWSTFSWPKNRAVAVRITENFPPRQSEPRESTVQLIVATHIENPDQKGGLDDLTLEEMEQDMIEAMETLDQVKVATQSAIHAAIFQGSIEWHDVGCNVQGYTCNFTVTY